MSENGAPVVSEPSPPITYQCENCGHELPKPAYEAQQRRAAEGLPVDCDYCKS